MGQKIVESKKELANEKVYKAFIEKMKKITKERQKNGSKIKSFVECLLVKLGLKKTKKSKEKRRLEERNLLNSTR